MKAYILTKPGVAKRSLFMQPAGTYENTHFLREPSQR